MKGKGAQYNPGNPFSKYTTGIVHDEGIDEYTHEERAAISVFFETPKNILSRNTSPDLSFDYSINPYQGCEHGCVYCYARNSHTYWGFSAGLDFESKIIVKKDIARRLDEEMSRLKTPKVIMLSGNTDCYQPLEKQFRLTRSILEVLLKYGNPVGIVTKNALVSRDRDVLQEMAKKGLVHVYFSITSLDEKLRSKLEPRTSTAPKKLEAMNALSKIGVPVGIMNAPIIPGLNHHEIPSILKAASEHGALGAGFTVVRLNGQIGDIFEDWVKRHYPDRSQKIISQVKDLHGGKVNDTEWGRRMSGSGNYAEIIRQLFRVAHDKYFLGKIMPPFNLNIFRKGGNYSLFE